MASTHILWQFYNQKTHHIYISDTLTPFNVLSAMNFLAQQYTVVTSVLYLHSLLVNIQTFLCHQRGSRYDKVNHRLHCNDYMNVIIHTSIQSKLWQSCHTYIAVYTRAVYAWKHSRDENLQQISVLWKYNCSSVSFAVGLWKHFLAFVELKSWKTIISFFEIFYAIHIRDLRV